MIQFLNSSDRDKQVLTLKSQEVQLWLTKFKLETSYELKDVLMQVGMNEPFNRADFSKMTKDKTPLEISRIIQKAFVEVNEKVTETAAVAVVMMAIESRHQST